MDARYNIYCQILRYGILNIRTYADDPKRCFAEADHIHNLPTLLQNFEDKGLHNYYWDVERPAFIRAAKPEWTKLFQPLWDELEKQKTYQITGANAG